MHSTIQDNAAGKGTDERPLTLLMVRPDPRLNPTSESRSLRGAESPDPYGDYSETTLSEILDLDLRNSRLIVDPTYRCNFNCRFCSLPVHDTEQLGWDRTIVVLKALALSGLRRAVLSGGEPGIYPQTPEILFNLRNMKISTTVLTNGIWAHDERRLKEIVTAGASGFLVSIKAFDDAGYRKITGRKVAGKTWKAALANFAGQMAKHSIDYFGVNIVINTINLDGLQDTDWIEQLPVRPRITLSLVEPYTNEMLGLVPRPHQLKGVLHSLLNNYEKLGIEYAVEGMPLCLLEDRWRKSIDPGRLKDRDPRIFVRPANGKDYLMVHTGYQRLLQFSQLPECDVCIRKLECPGPHKRTHRLYEGTALSPFHS